MTRCLPVDADPILSYPKGTMKVTSCGTSLPGDGLGVQPAPDFGLALKAQGWSPTARLEFPLFHSMSLAGQIGPPMPLVRPGTRVFM